MLSYLSPEERVPANHPLRPIRLMVDDALRKALSPAFSRLYSAFGRPSVIPPEKLLRKALLLQVLYTVRSERMLMEVVGANPQYYLIFRWFVGLNMDETVGSADGVQRKESGPASGKGDIAEEVFLRPCWLRRGLPTYSRTSTSAWTEPSSKPGRVRRRVFSGRIGAGTAAR